MKLKPPADVTDFLEEFLELAREKSGRIVFCDELAQEQIRRVEFDKGSSDFVDF